MTMESSVTYDLVRIHDRLQAVRDRQQRNIFSELGAKRLLDDRVRLVVLYPDQQLHLTSKRITLTNGRRRFVEDKEFASAHDGPREREDLALPDRQVRSTPSDLAIQRDPRLIVLVLEIEKTG